MVLIGFEESQAIANQYRLRGIEAYSCDILPCSGGHPEYHLCMPIEEVLEHNYFDIIILHPPCTKTCLAGNRWYSQTRERREAEEYTKSIFKLAIARGNKVALEQPKSIIKNPTQIIQPWMFGHGEVKETWLWLYNLPKLIPTDIVDGREQRVLRMSPGKDRSKERSKTYKGIAEAISIQWT